MSKKWKQPPTPKWVVRARAMIEASKPFKVGSTIHLLEMATNDYLYAEMTLAGIAGRLTTEEGNRDATESQFDLGYDEIIEMAHDDMIFCARNELKR
jgi:hypothetical protein